MKFGILTGYDLRRSRQGWHFEDLSRAGQKLGVDIVPIEARTLVTTVSKAGGTWRGNNIDLTELDGLLVRAMPTGSLEQIIFRMDALNRLYDQGLPIINPPRAVETAVDKYLSLARLSSAGLPVPRTSVAEKASAALEDFEKLGGDTIVKPLFGSEGRGILRLSNPELAIRTFRTLEQIGAVIYQQEFLSHPGWDLRVLIIGGQAVAAMRRYSTPDTESWKTNITAGGRGEPHELDETQLHLSLSAANAVGTVIAGVDLIFCPDLPDNWNIIEVNAAPGWRALSQVTETDIAKQILHFLVSNLGTLSSHY